MDLRAVLAEFGTLFHQCKITQGFIFQKRCKPKQQIKETTAPTNLLGNVPLDIHHHRFHHAKKKKSGSYFLSSSKLELIWPLGLQFLFNDSTTSREGGQRDHCHLY